MNQPNSPTPLSVSATAHAKVNLHLGCGDARDDGFHELVTVFQSLSLPTTVTLTEVVSGDATSHVAGVTVSGESAAHVPTDETNLAWRAVSAAVEAAESKIPRVAAIHIDKSIPVAGGMAGGSADAAAALVAAREFFELPLTDDELADLAADLGSDVPFCLLGGTALGTGRGENLAPVLVRGEYHWALALAKGGLSTPKVFGTIDRLRAERDVPHAAAPDELLKALASGDPDALAAHLANDLQPAAISLKPELRTTLRAGLDGGALAGIVSGSGPTTAFLCRDREHALDVAAHLATSGACAAALTASGPATGARLS
ncbi:4-(cytidine 5'-diphospho)-2-C-methyl-D-erythritol kinase [uncultured Corynebacterium sp.]|uniref:4-(cytidine 5'-diphospho)-2-C-methyl-D-erythritol kinase n=1 Tax=uncultured Corynebacterium sp. TaxID=159447 RepID=UPI0025D46F1F|nr:4-(cytidine 5'-diphospho)-2-C-methyl-D-erythritol kinase [uncultured Corynebacterium sp.]